MNKKQNLILSIVIVLSGYLFQMYLQSIIRPEAIYGFYFQEWSSEMIMQTVSLEELISAPLESLFNIHIQPPAFDTIRTILVHLWPDPDPSVALRHVDLLIYQLWALLYGVLGMLIFSWLSQLTNIKIALVSAILFLLHPASLFYATLLDTTLLSSVLILWVFYLLWEIKNGNNVSIVLFALVVLALFFTRSIFQLPSILIFALSLFLLRVPKQKIFLFLLIAGGISSLYIAKQYHQFGLFSTSSFMGINLTRSVGISDDAYFYTYLDNVTLEAKAKNTLPKVLTRKVKVTFSPNLNHISYLELNQQLLIKYKEYILKTPISDILKIYLDNLSIYFQPSSRYTPHVIVDKIPWRSFYDQIFSAPILPIMLALAGVVWLAASIKHKDYCASAGLILPGLYIFLTSIILERGENMRFKFFLEPVLFVFLVSMFYVLIRLVRQKAVAAMSRYVRTPLG
jgi:hypothetical protein